MCLGVVEFCVDPPSGKSGSMRRNLLADSYCDGATRKVCRVEEVLCVNNEKGAGCVKIPNDSKFHRNESTLAQERYCDFGCSAGACLTPTYCQETVPIRGSCVGPGLSCESGETDADACTTCSQDGVTLTFVDGWDPTCAAILNEMDVDLLEPVRARGRQEEFRRDWNNDATHGNDTECMAALERLGCHASYVSCDETEAIERTACLASCRRATEACADQEFSRLAGQSFNQPLICDDANDCAAGYSVLVEEVEVGSQFHQCIRICRAPVPVSAASVSQRAHVAVALTALTMSIM